MGEVKNKPILFREKAFAVFVLLYGSTAFTRLLLSPEDYSAVGDENLKTPIKIVLWLTIYLIAAYFTGKLYHSVTSTLKQMPVFIALMGFIIMSVLWSGFRSASLLSVCALLGNSLIGFYFGVRYSVREFLRLLGWVYGIVVVCTFLSPLFTAHYAIDIGYWTGFFSNKNYLGVNVLIGFLVFNTLARTAKQRKWLYHSCSVLCAVLIFLSGAATCMVIFVLLACAMIFRAFAERHLSSASSRARFGVVALACLTVFAWLNLDRILEALGRSPDLTGRVQVWGFLMLMAGIRPILGYGYGGFWVVGGPAQDVWDAFQVDPTFAPHTHNGYLQLFLDCGIIGLGLLLVLLLIAVRKAWTYAIATKNFWPLYLVVVLSLHNTTDTTFAARNHICWLLFVAVLVQLTRASVAEVRAAVQTKTTYPARADIYPASA
jgi:exopolysaccharide production protein ExoQ